MVASPEQLSMSDAAQEAYASSLFEDMAQLIVSQKAIIKEVSAERDEYAVAYSEQLDTNVTLARGLIAGKEKNDELSKLAKTDSKTGLLNPVAFEEEVLKTTRPTKRARDRKVFSLVFADFDDFKQLNSLLDEVVNDYESLIPAATIFRSEVRQEDLVSRWGGEEFAFFLHAAPQAAAIRMQAIREKINCLPISHPELQLGITMGIAEFRRGANYSEVVRRANAAMREAKGVPGKNTTLIWSRKHQY